MSAVNEHAIEIRVRYQETDAQGHVHHANYFNFFEIGRVELLRANGQSYRKLEEDGVILVVSEITCRYYLPAKYDDLLHLTTSIESGRGARIRHRYHLRRETSLLAEGQSTVASIDRNGRPMRLPGWLQVSRNSASV